MKCHICIYWTPEHGCNHYKPDPATVLKLKGYTIRETVKGKIYVDGKFFKSLEYAADQLVHSQKQITT